MTTSASLFSCSAADVTVDRVRQLVDQNMPESLTLEYKEVFSSGIIKTIAAMANSYGGIVIVGVKDGPGDERLVGVGEATITQIVNACHDSLEPPWIPEIIPVRVSPSSEDLILVIRIDSNRAPRPILLNSSAPIRLQGRNAMADRNRLAQLFGEVANGENYSRRSLTKPELPTGRNGDRQGDFIMRTGIWVPVSESASWRPISEQGIEEFIRALEHSPLRRMLSGWIRPFKGKGINPFQQEGLNTSRRVRLIWQAELDAPVPYPVQSIVQLHLPDGYGSPTSTMSITIDVFVQIRRVLASLSDQTHNSVWHLEVAQVYATLQGMLAGLTDSKVIDSIAKLVDIDPLLVPQPLHAYFRTGPPVNELLGGNTFLSGITGASESRGSDLVADPTLDLSDDIERNTQVELWVQQIAQDAGIRGMHEAILFMHEQEMP